MSEVSVATVAGLLARILRTAEVQVGGCSDPRFGGQLPAVYSVFKWGGRRYCLQIFKSSGLVDGVDWGSGYWDVQAYAKPFRYPKGHPQRGPWIFHGTSSKGIIMLWGVADNKHVLQQKIYEAVCEIKKDLAHWRKEESRGS